jgi:hypothetical protein
MSSGLLLSMAYVYGIDLLEEPSEKTIPSKSLQADWLADTLELFVTEETFNEIHRNQEPASFKKSRQFAMGFYCLPCDTMRFNKVAKSIRPLFPQSMRSVAPLPPLPLPPVSIY